MRRFSIVAGLLLILLLVACTPRVQPTAEREGDQVVITVTADQALYAATLQVFNATTEDTRCGVLNVVDLGCTLGDIPAGDTVTVVVAGEVGQVHCIVFGFADPDLGINSYRPYRCNLGGT